MVKKFLIIFLMVQIALTAIWVIGARAQIGVGTPSSRWVYDAYQKKTQIAQDRAQHHRILIVAGSNAMFGIDSSMIEDTFHKPTINLGVNAGLALPYILYHAKQTAQQGDIIFLPLEYALYIDEGKPNSQIIDYAFARDTSYLSQLTIYQKVQFAWGMSPQRWVQGLQRKITQAPDANTNGVYGAHHLNERGDQTHTSPQEQLPVQAANVQKAQAWHYGERALQEAGAWEKLQAFAEWGKHHQICIIAMPTALMKHHSYFTNPIENQLYQDLPKKVESLGLPYAGQPQTMMYDRNHFFDTDHHLQDWARTIHTQNLIQAIKAKQACGL